MKTLVFTTEDITEIVRRVGVDKLMDDTIARLTETCRSYDTAKYKVPMRGGFESNIDGELGLLEWMPAIQSGSHATIKIVGYHPNNPTSRSLPTILSVALRYDAKSGHLTGLMDGVFATALRTGAASALASRILARDEACVLGLIGCGAQAVTQLHALSRCFDFESVLIADVDPNVAGSFAQRIEVLDLSIPIEIVPLQTLTRNADILCTATSVGVGDGPIFRDDDFKNHLHINAVGSDFPGKTELPNKLLKRSLVCPDFRDQAVSEGECQQLHDDEIGPDLIELVQNVEQFIEYRAQPTVFDSTGWALQDHVVVDILTEIGTELGCGTELELESINTDPKNPYEFVNSVRVTGEEALFAVEK